MTDDEITDYRLPLGDILSITTGRLVSRRGIEGVYKILNHMTGENLMTHQLPRVSDECKPHLLEQLPQLAAVEPPVFRDADHVWSWLTEQENRFGGMLCVEPLAAGVHDKRNPIEELYDMVGPEKVFVVDSTSLDKYEATR